MLDTCIFRTFQSHKQNTVIFQTSRLKLHSCFENFDFDFFDHKFIGIEIEVSTL